MSRLALGLGLALAAMAGCAREVPDDPAIVAAGAGIPVGAIGARGASYDPPSASAAARLKAQVPSVEPEEEPQAPTPEPSADPFAAPPTPSAEPSAEPAPSVAPGPHSPLPPLSPKHPPRRRPRRPSPTETTL